MIGAQLCANGVCDLFDRIPTRKEGVRDLIAREPTLVGVLDESQHSGLTEIQPRGLSPRGLRVGGPCWYLPIEGFISNTLMSLKSRAAGRQQRSRPG
jgi:hypothetical protein